MWCGVVVSPLPNAPFKTLKTSTVFCENREETRKPIKLNELDRKTQLNTVLSRKILFFSQKSERDAFTLFI